MSVQTRINAVVYAKGIETTITNSTKKLAVVLLDDSERIIATSALISKGEGSSEDGGGSEGAATYLSNSFSFNTGTKQLAVPIIAYTATKSLVSGGDTPPVAKGFAVVAFNNQDESSEEAFEGAGKFFKFPSFSSMPGLGDSYDSDEAVPLIVGTLSTDPIINPNSNFRLTSTTITFSETSVN